MRLVSLECWLSARLRWHAWTHQTKMRGEGDANDDDAVGGLIFYASPTNQSGGSTGFMSVIVAGEMIHRDMRLERHNGKITTHANCPYQHAEDARGHPVFRQILSTRKACVLCRGCSSSLAGPSLLDPPSASSCPCCFDWPLNLISALVLVPGKRVFLSRVI